MKTTMTTIITIGLFLLAVIAMLAVSPAYATDRCEKPPVATPQPTSTVPVSKKHKTSWQLPILIIGIGAGVWCWFECTDSKPPTKVDPEPLTITPKQATVFNR